MNEKQRQRATEALRLAVERVGRKRLAEICGIGLTATYNWDALPAQHVLRVQEATGVPASWLRPDYYPGLEVVDD
jgi:hypothetical protein